MNEFELQDEILEKLNEMKKLAEEIYPLTRKYSQIMLYGDSSIFVLFAPDSLEKKLIDDGIMTYKR